MNIYHYTFGHKMPEIANDGYLRPTGVNIAHDERPVLWFSRNPVFERTAAKGTLENGKVRLMNFGEMHEHLGIYRFALPMPDQRVFTWVRLPKLANIPQRVVKHMISEGVRRGAKPSDWLGTFVPIALHEMKFEVWDGDKWVNKR